MTSRLFAFLLHALLVVAVFSEPSRNLEGKIRFIDRKPFNETAVVHLNYGEFETYAQADGSFVIYDVPPGVHVLTVHNPNHHFAQVKIQLLEEDMENPNCIEYAYPGAPKSPVMYPLVLTALGSYQYFEKKPGFSFSTILRNPMFMMMACK